MLVDENEVRVLTKHLVPGAETSLKLSVTDTRGHGNANHRYEITGFNISTNPSAEVSDRVCSSTILFQNGTIPESGVNGVTIETLLAICVDRLEGFQSGKFACNDNEQALFHLNQAIGFLNIRTKNRVARNVEGKHVE